MSDYICGLCGNVRRGPEQQPCDYCERRLALEECRDEICAALRANRGLRAIADAGVKVQLAFAEFGRRLAEKLRR